MFREKTFTNYMKLTNKLLPIGVLFFIVVILIMLLHDKVVCDPRERKIEENLEYVAKNENSINKIILTKSAPGYEINLINNDFIIVDSMEISKIRSMINIRKQGQWNNSKRDWEVLMILYLSNGNEVEIELSQIIKDSSTSKTVMYFLFGNCDDDYPKYSTGLGEYLEHLINYNGRKYK